VKARGVYGVAFVVGGVACVVLRAVRGVAILVRGHERELPRFFFSTDAARAAGRVRTPAGPLGAAREVPRWASGHVGALTSRLLFFLWRRWRRCESLYV